MKKQVFIWLFVCPFLLKGQEAIDVAQFFSRALASSDSTAFSPAKALYFPWIEKYELRSQTNDFDRSRQQYTLRITPSTIRKRNAQKALSDQMRLAPDFDQQERFCESLFDVYADWLGLYLLHEEQKLLQALDTLYQDRQGVFEKMAGAYELDFKELIRLQTEKSELSTEQHELSLELARLREKYGFPQGDFDFRDFVSLDNMQQHIRHMADDSLAASDAELAYERELLDRELALEVAESRQLFDFAQFRYEGPRTDLFRERFSVGIGLRLPNSGSRRLKIQELQIGQKALEREQIRDAAQRQQSISELRQKLLRDIGTYTFYLQNLAEERSQLQSLAGQIASKEGYSPLLLLDIEQRNIQSRLKAFKKQEDLLYDYLHFLEVKGTLCERTDVNFLGR